jgi:integrase
MPSRIPTDELIADLQRVTAITDGPPSSDDYKTHGRFSLQTYHNRFGSWKEALSEIGFNPDPVEINPDNLLSDIVKVATDGIAPSVEEYREQGAYTKDPFLNRYYSWWAATVRAGCRPVKRRPLKPAAMHQLYQTASNLPPADALPPLLFMFTGLSPNIAEHLTQDWLADRRNRHIVKVPPDHTHTGEPWLFRIPETWQSPHTNETLPTHLPQVLNWVFSHHGRYRGYSSDIFYQCCRVARKANLANREHKKYKRVGEVPLVRPSDIRMTYGINLARQGIRSDTIKQRLGIKHTGWNADVQEIFIWLDEREDYQHPDYNNS